MKTISFTILFTLLLALVLGPVAAQTPRTDDALNAFGISFSIFNISSMMSAFGEPVEGFSVEENESSGVIHFKNMSLASL